MTKLVFEPSETTHWKNLFPNKMQLLGSQNLNSGEELVATIESVAIEEIKGMSGESEHVPVLKFTNAPPMVLNITNTRTIASLYGDSYENWQGKSIQLYATQVRGFGGDQVTALRIREAIPDTKESIEHYIESLIACGSIKELQTVYSGIPKHLKPRVAETKDNMKEQINAGS